MGMGEYEAKTRKSKILHERAEKVLPGGVSYAIRYFEPYPFYTVRAKGSKLFDVDGNEYVDFWLGHTALILGHSPPKVMKDVGRQMNVGTHFGTAHELEVKLAEQIAKMVPSAEVTRFTNSGTEANMYAVRLARAYTGRSKILKFEGGWHGGYDALHVGVRPPFDVPESAGLTKGAVQDTLLAPFNDIEEVRKGVEGKDVAAIIIEPVLGSGGCIPAEKEFLKELRELCDERGILLIFDEVITGFRLAPGGAQQYFGVESDLTVFGKILGGGFPVGAFSGNREIMGRLNTRIFHRPQNSFHGGTFSANPVTMVAGLATLKILEDGRRIAAINKIGEKIKKETADIFESHDINVQVTGVGSLFRVHFAEKPVKNVLDTYGDDEDKLSEYHQHLITRGVFFLPTHLGALSTAHTKADINKLFTLTEDYAKKQKP
jgi:glutamate-1-semialdehyde 2,1-aminomutase